MAQGEARKPQRLKPFSLPGGLARLKPCPDGPKTKSGRGSKNLVTLGFRPPGKYWRDKPAATKPCRGGFMPNATKFSVRARLQPLPKPVGLEKGFSH